MVLGLVRQGPGQAAFDEPAADVGDGVLVDVQGGRDRSVGPGRPAVVGLVGLEQDAGPRQLAGGRGSGPGQRLQFPALALR